MLKNLYVKLCMSSVFRGVLEKPLLKRFAEYCTSEDEASRTLAYAAFVKEIYDSETSLTDLVLKLVFEDENIFFPK